MDSALFIIYPTRSHVISVATLGKALLQAGYTVHFFGCFDENTTRFIIEQGFKAIQSSTAPFGLAYHDLLHFYKKLGKTKRQLIIDIFLDNDYTRRLKEIEVTLLSLTPTKVFLDSLLSSDFICVYPCINKRTTHFFFINTMAIYYSKSRPPANTFLHPSQSTLIKIVSFLLIQQKRISELLESVFLLGRDSCNRVKAKAAQVGIRYSMHSNYPFNIIFPEIPEIVFSHCELDFPGPTFNKRLYLGFAPFLSRRHTMLRKEYERLVALLNCNKQIIYVCLGTTNITNTKIKPFIRKLSQTANLLPQCTFIVSFIPKLIANDIPPNKHSNFHVFGFIPQLQVLSRASAFITHGGFNSIKESIHYQVPMLVIPTNVKYDQPGNCSRVTYHQIGLRLRFTDSKQTIIYKLTTLLTKDAFKYNLKKFNDLELQCDFSRLVNDEIITGR